MRRLYQQRLLEKPGRKIYTNNLCWRNPDEAAVPAVHAGIKNHSPEGEAMYSIKEDYPLPAAFKYYPF